MKPEIQIPESFLPLRPDYANKYTFGSLLIIAGSKGMTGAAVLAAKAALRAGAGLVTVACPDTERAIIATALPETMTFGAYSENGAFCAESAKEILSFVKNKKFSTMLIGPGLSCTEKTTEFVKIIMENTALPAVIDADALNCVSKTGGFDRIKRISAVPVIITPHEGEAARLTGIKKIEDRRAAVRKLASLCTGIAILKGPETLVACGSRYLHKEDFLYGAAGNCSGKDAFSEYGDCIEYRNNTGGSELAKAGSGDVLAGIISSIYMQNGLAKGFNHKTAFESAAVSVHIHGLCGLSAAEKYTKRCVIASDLAGEMPYAFRAVERIYKNAVENMNNSIGYGTENTAAEEKKNGGKAEK